MRNKNNKKRVKSKNTNRFSSLFTKDNPSYKPRSGKYIVAKDGKKIKNKKRVLSPLKIIRNLFVIFLGFCLLFSIYAFCVIAISPKIDPKHIYDEISQSSVIYDDKGNEYGFLTSSEERTLVDYKEIPEHTKNAFIALEDKTFLKHNGLNYTRLVGATLNIFKGSSISGTSTITQQLARNVYLPNIKSRRSIKRKVLEIYYAKKIERNLSKDKIMEAYLNSIYFGYGNYGIERAAKVYFSKNVSDLTLEESAALAALPQAPDSYALIKDFDGKEYDSNTSTVINVDSRNLLCNDISADRRNLCLKLMKDQGYIDEAEYKSASSKKLIDFINPSIREDNNTDYFKDYLAEEVTKDLIKKYKMNEDEAYKLVYRGGLKIYSTVDTQAQNVIEKEFNNNSIFPRSIPTNKDSSGNILNDSGTITLYKYGNLINDSGDFTFASDECKKNDDGSLTIYKGHRLNIYTTKTDSGKDYSLEFKPMYLERDGSMYICQGGYINIPTEDKKLDKDGNLIINKKFFKDNPSMFDLSGDNVIIHNTGYTLQEHSIQPQAAMVINDNETGAIKAMVGGRGITGQRSFNRATSPRQPGSSIKPLAIYSSAIQHSYELQSKGRKFKAKNIGNDTQGSKYYGDYLTEASVIIDEPIRIGGRIWPYNADRRFRGKMTMKQALEQSINVASVKLYEQLGNDYCLEMAKKFGLKHLVTSGETSDSNPAALALGAMTKGVTTQEMAEAYTAFPNGGIRKSSIVYTKILDKDGVEILKSKQKSTKVLDEGVAFIMKDMLQSNVSRGIAGPAAISGQAVGGKTGTTNDNYDIWFCGFTAKYSGALWIGNDVNMYVNGGSSIHNASIWSRIMRQIDGALNGKYKGVPSNVVKSGNDYFIKGTVMKSPETEEELKKKAEEERLKAEEEERRRMEAEENEDDDEDIDSGEDEEDPPLPPSPPSPSDPRPNNP